MSRLPLCILLSTLLLACGPSGSEDFNAIGAGEPIILPPARSHPKRLASGQGKPYGLAVGLVSLFWTNSGTGEVMMLPLDGGTPSALATGQVEPRGIAASDGSVFWVNFGASTVMTVPATGGVPTLIAQGVFQPTSIAVDSGSIYWNELAINGSVWRAPIGGGAEERLYADQSGAAGLSLCGDSIFWENGNPGEIQRGLKIGGTHGYVSSGQKNPIATECDSSHVYWVNQGSFFEKDGAVVRVGIQGGNPQLLAGGQGTPSDLAIDDAWVYWTNIADGTVNRVPKAGGPVERMASGQHRPRAIALSTTQIFWVNEGEGTSDGEVMALSKP